MYIHIHVCKHVAIFIQTPCHPSSKHVPIHIQTCSHPYWVATISRLLKIIGLFCRIWSLL